MSDNTAVCKRQGMPRSRIILLCLFGIYLIMTFIGAACHEVWYDEAQAWNIVKYNDIPGIIDFMKYEGHPMLWHLVLFPFTRLGLPVDILPFIGWFISSVAAGLMLWKAPFKPLMKGVVLFSGAFIFYDSIVSRVYCIMLLILVLLGIVYKKRSQHPVIYGLLIALLANTHVMMSGLVGILGIYMIIELFSEWRTSTRKTNILRLIGLAVAGVGVILLIIPLIGCIGANDLASRKASSISALDVFVNMINTFATITSGALFNGQLPFLGFTLNWTLSLIVGTALVVWLILFRHYRKHFIIAVVFTAVYSVICCVIWCTIPPRAEIFVFTYAVIYWFAIETEKPVYKEPKPLKAKTSRIGISVFSCIRRLDKRFEKMTYVILCAYIAATIPVGSSQLICDYFMDYSFSKATAEFVRAELPDDAVLIAETAEIAPSYIAYLPDHKFYSLRRADFFLYSNHKQFDDEDMIDYKKIYEDLKDYDHLYLMVTSKNLLHGRFL